MLAKDAAILSTTVAVFALTVVRHPGAIAASATTRQQADEENDHYVEMLMHKRGGLTGRES